MLQASGTKPVEGKPRIAAFVVDHLQALADGQGAADGAL